MGFEIKNSGKKLKENNSIGVVSSVKIFFILLSLLSMKVSIKKRRQLVALTIGVLGCGMVLGFGNVWAEQPVEDNQLIEKMGEKTLKLEDLKFKQVNSCTDLEVVLKKYIENANYPHYEYSYDKKEIVGNVGFDKSDDVREDLDGAVDHSSTNNQKKGVDEPDIIKNDGNYVYYYNTKKHKVYVIKSPLFDGKLDLNNVNAETIINIPKLFGNVQLFINKDKLIILSTRYQKYHAKYWGIGNNQKTAMIVYDLSDKRHPKIDRFNDVNGYLKDARLIGDTLYVFSESSLYNPMPYYRKIDNSLKGKDEKKVDKAINTRNFLPTLLDLRADGKLDLKLYTADCDKISYVMPEDDVLKGMYTRPVFTTITAVDTQNYNKKPQLTVLLSPVSHIHVSQENVYLTDYLSLPTSYNCGWSDMCIMPRFDEGGNTLIHKFSIDGMQLKYVNSNVVSGDPLTQYSMDEDSKGYFRILTRKGWNKGTNFFTLGSNLELLGKLENIEPKENFQSSRYIGDKLYLVTFRQVDPLFVIDIADVKSPKIIGAMKTPGYSTYLHPLGNMKGNIQYLIGLGYGTKIRGKSSLVNFGVKISLYKVDYSQKETVQTKCGDLEKNTEVFDSCKEEVDPNNIAITTVSEKIYGEQGSNSEVLRNPRLFVMNKNNRLTLPLFLQKKVREGERCSFYVDTNGVETKKNCYPVDKNITDFVGLKSWDIDPTTGITEVFSVNYKELFKKKLNNEKNYGDDLWGAKWSNMRVGYIGDIVFMINDFFADFTQNNQHKYLFFQDEK